MPSRRARLDEVERAQRLDERRRIVGRGDDVEVLDRVGQAARAAGDLDALGRRVGAQLLDDRLAGLEGAVEQDPDPRRVGDARRDRLEHLLLELRPEPLDATQPLSFGGRAQRVDRVDLELLVEAPRALGAQARQPHHRDDARRVLGAQLLGRRDRAGLDQRDDLLLERRADALQLGRTAFARERRHRHGRLANLLGGGPVGDDAVDDRAVQLVEVAQLVERLGDRRIGYVAHRDKGRGATAGGRRLKPGAGDADLP